MKVIISESQYKLIEDILGDKKYITQLNKDTNGDYSKDLTGYGDKSDQRPRYIPKQKKEVQPIKKDILTDGDIKLLKYYLNVFSLQNGSVYKGSDYQFLNDMVERIKNRGDVTSKERNIINYLRNTGEIFRETKFTDLSHE